MNNVKIFYSNFWTSGDLVGTSALHVQLVRRTSQHWIVIWTLQRKTSCLLSIRKSLACVCVCVCIEINNNKHVYRQSQVRKPPGSGVEWAECSMIIGTVCQRAFSLLAIWCLRPPRFESCIQQRKTTCLLSIRTSLACAKASKLTTTNMYVCMCMYFDSKFACLCQSIKINNNQPVYR